MQGELDRLRRRLHRLQERIYAWTDALRVRRRGGKKLFIDAGANLGQGFGWFSKRFDDPDMVFELLEPNPYCQTALADLVARCERQATVLPVALGAEAGKLKFYGLSDDQGGATSQGGSIVKDHNSAYYASDETTAIEVDVIDTCAYLKARARDYDIIVMKMDIEGAELDVLDAMLEDGCIDAIDTLYVEFHSQYRVGEARQRAAARERDLIGRLRRRGLRLRIWH